MIQCMCTYSTYMYNVLDNVLVLVSCELYTSSYVYIYIQYSVCVLFPTELKVNVCFYGNSFTSISKCWTASQLKVNFCMYSE